MVDGLFGSTEALRARMQAAYIEMEQSAFEALCELWPQTRPPSGLSQSSPLARCASRRKLGGEMVESFLSKVPTGELAPLLKEREREREREREWNLYPQTHASG